MVLPTPTFRPYTLGLPKSLIGLHKSAHRFPVHTTPALWSFFTADGSGTSGDSANSSTSSMSDDTGTSGTTCTSGTTGNPGPTGT